MKSVLSSIQPGWVEKICHQIGEEKGKPVYKKQIEVRKSKPSCEVPFKCYIYATKAKKWFRSGIILTSNELLWLSSGKIQMCDGFELWADGEDYQCVNGKVVGEFICDEIIEWQYNKGHQYYVDYPDDCTSYFPYLKCHSEATGLKCSEIENYGKGKPLYGWHISDLKIYDKPRELSEFYKPCPDKYQYCQGCKHGLVTLSADEEEYAFYHGGQYDYFKTFCLNKVTRPPQSWCYVEEVELK